MILSGISHANYQGYEQNIHRGCFGNALNLLLLTHRSALRKQQASWQKKQELQKKNPAYCFERQPI